MTWVENNFWRILWSLSIWFYQGAGFYHLFLPVLPRHTNNAVYIRLREVVSVSPACLRMSKVTFCPGIKLSPLMYSTIPELIAISSLLERPSFCKHCWIAETMQGWNISPEGKNNEMYFHQKSEIVRKKREGGEKAGGACWLFHRELLIVNCSCSPNSFLRSPFRQSILKLYVLPGLKFKNVQKEVQQPWLTVKH